MAKQTGTYSVADLLDTRFQSLTVAQFGLDTIVQVAEDDLVAHNAIVNDLLTEFCDVSEDLLRVSGSSLGGDMQEVDEYGLSSTQKSSPGQTVGFPLRSFQFNVGWTKRFFEKASVRDWALMTDAAEKAHLRAIQRGIKRAIFGATNYSFVDFLNHKVTLPVKAFYNADGTNIPDGPNGETFNGASHTHYLGSATLTTTAMDALINTVLEHAFGNKMMVAFSHTDEATVRGLSGFIAAADPRLILSVNQNQADQRLDLSRLDNRMIGYYGAAEIWIKPWMVANYAFCSDIQNGMKPLVFREDVGGAAKGLYVAAELDDYPLYAKAMQAEFGVGVWNRGNGAVLQFNNASYTAPTIS